MKQKSVLENTQSPFNTEDTVKRDYHDLSLIQKQAEAKERAQMQRFLRNQVLEGTLGSGNADIAEKMSLQEGMEDRKETIRGQKKRELRDQDRIIQQFDKLATQFERQQGANSTQKAKKGRGEEVAETAGMLKKRTKKKKEKSLSAKLRLREKKGK